MNQTPAASTPTASPDGIDVSSHGLPRTDVPDTAEGMVALAELLAKADLFVPAALHGKPASIAALMMRARALDVPLAVAWDEMYVTGDGEVGRSARLVRALIQRAGHTIEYPEHDRHHAVAVLRLSNGARHEIAFTMEDAVEMGFTHPDYPFAREWRRQPENMLIARVTTRAATWHCPGVFLGMGVEPGAPYDAEYADTIAVVREERRAAADQILRLITLAARQPSGPARLKLLAELFAYARGEALLLFAVADDAQLSVRDVLTDAMRDADETARAQASGQAPPGDAATGPTTLEELRALDLEERAAEQDPAEESADASADTPGRTPGRTDVRPGEEPGTLPCGCLIDRVLATAAHSPGCTDAAQTEEASQ